MKFLRNLLFLTFGFMLTAALLPAAAFADEIYPQNVQTITDGDTLSAVVEVVGDKAVCTGEQYAWFEFTPAVTGVYIFEGSHADGVPSCTFSATLFDSNLKTCRIVREQGSPGMFKLISVLNEGQTYYYGVESTMDDEGGQVSVHLYRDENSVFAVEPVGETDLHVALNTILTLEVKLPPKAEVCSFQWYMNGEPVDGEYHSSYQTPPIVKDCIITCSVSDIYGNTREIQFTIDTDDEFIASAVNDVQTVMPGDRVLLETEASAPGPLSYQWYRQVYDQEIDDWVWEPINGATGETFVIAAANQDNIGSYRCDVTEVDTGITQQLLFDVFYPNHYLEARDKATGDTWVALEVKPDAPLKLEVDITTLDMSMVSCQWRVEYYNYEHSRVVESKVLTDAVSNVLNISAVKASGDYVCHVEDIFGNEHEIRYNVTVVTGLKAYDKKTKEGVVVLEPAPGESLTMTAAGTTDIGVPVKYQWTKEEIEYESEDIGVQVKVDIPGATSASYTVKKPVYEMYSCVVTDGYRNYKWVTYVIQVQNGLDVWVKTPKSGSTTIYVPYNGSVTMEVGAKAKTGKLHYEWSTTEYGEFGFYGSQGKYTKKVSNRADYTLKNIKTLTSCCCTVTDDYGGSTGMVFDVYVDTGLKAYAAGTKKTTADISVVPKCNAQLSVDASAKTGKALQYRWGIWKNAWTDENGNWYESQWVSAGGSSTKTYTVRNVTHNQKYRCLVSDGYGGVKIVTFNVKKTSEFTDVSNEKVYYYEPVYWAVENGITVGAGGNGKFAPNEACTREQIVTFLWRLMGEPEPQKIETFTDVKADAWYAKPISWAYEQGITTGLNDGTGRFGVGQPCKREMCVTFLYRAAGKPAVQGSNSFTDMAEGAYYVDAVTWAVNKGITTGLNDGTGRFGVGQTCTRAMIVTFLYRYAHLQ